MRAATTSLVISSTWSMTRKLEVFGSAPSTVDSHHPGVLWRRMQYAALFIWLTVPAYVLVTCHITLLRLYNSGRQPKRGLLQPPFEGENRATVPCQYYRSCRFSYPRTDFLTI